MEVEKTAELCMSNNVIATKDLSKTYGKGDLQVHALRKTNIEIIRGEYIAIIGPSGSGKSTFMNLVGCLDKPSSGSLYIDDTDVSNHLLVMHQFQDLICLLEPWHDLFKSLT